MTKPIGIGVVGIGRIGWAHCACIHNLADRFHLAAVADIIPERLEEAREKYGCNVYDDVADLARDPAVELVVIASTTYLHQAHALQTFAAGKHVVCDKPVASNLAETDAMIAAARRAGKLFTVYQQCRIGGDTSTVREVIHSGKLGRINQIRLTANYFARRWDWQMIKRLGGGRLRNHGIHLIDMAMSLIACEEPEVFSSLERTITLGDADDYVKVILKSPHEPLIDIEMTSTCAYPTYAWLVMGTRGTLKGTRRQLEWKYIHPSQFPPRELQTTAPVDRSFGQTDEDLPWQTESWDGTKAPHPMRAYYEALHETVRNGAPPLITIESVRRVMVVVDKCLRASELYAQPDAGQDTPPIAAT